MEYISLTHILTVAICLVSTVHSGWISGVCHNITNIGLPANQPVQPDIPDMFRVHVECNMVDRNLTIIVNQWYDFDENFGRIQQYDAGDQGDIYYDYQNNEIITIDNIAKTCIVSDLSKSLDRFMFGLKSKGSGEEHISSSTSALHFGDSFEKYAGRETVRGIIADKWTSCQYSDLLDATMNVTWYFSSQGVWTMQTGNSRSLPLRAVVVGRRNDAVGGSHSFNHTYDFFGFDPEIDPSDYELGDGIYCPNRLNTQPFPTMPSTFSLTGEVVSSAMGITQTFEEHYDSKNKMNVYRYKDQNQLTSLTGMFGFTEINDFHSGIAYIIDEIQTRCRMTTIALGDFAFVDPAGKGGSKIRMQTPAEFIRAANVSFEYGGTKKVRGINCDAWTGVTDKIIAYEGRNVTIEWYFATPDFRSSNQLADMYANYRIPILFRLWPSMDPKSNAGYTFNVFNFDLSNPRVGNLDISPCFTGSDRINIRFFLDAKYKPIVVNNLDYFRKALVETFSIFLGVSLLRITDIQVYTDTADLIVSFDLVDRPPIAGDVMNPAPENSLYDAVKILSFPKLESYLQFSVVVGNNGSNVVVIKPLDNSIQFIFSNGTCVGLCSSDVDPLTNGNNGYSRGFFGGLGAAMMVFGCGFGMVAGQFYFRRSQQNSSSFVRLADLMRRS